MNYREDASVAQPFRQQYLDGLKKLTERMENEEQKTRPLADIFVSPEKHREAFRKMLGWPLTAEIPIPAPQTVPLASESDIDISRMTFEILPGVPMTGLYFRHPGTEKRPFSIVSHGGLGTPELISGLYGNTSNYNDITMRIYNCGIDVFAPQLLIWDPNLFGVPFNRQDIDSRLKRLGGSVTALEIKGISDAVSWFSALPEVTTVGMAGLSYGGYYTLFCTAADTRISAALSCSFFSESTTLVQSDFCFFDAAHSYSAAEVAALIYPRPLILRSGDHDELFPMDRVQSEYDRLAEAAPKNGEFWPDFAFFDGFHEFVKDEASVKKFAELLRQA